MRFTRSFCKLFKSNHWISLNSRASKSNFWFESDLKTYHRLASHKAPSDWAPDFATLVLPHFTTGKFEAELHLARVTYYDGQEPEFWGEKVRLDCEALPDAQPANPTQEYTCTENSECRLFFNNDNCKRQSLHAKQAGPVNSQPKACLWNSCQILNAVCEEETNRCGFEVQPDL